MSFNLFVDIFNKNWDILITGGIIGIVLWSMQSKLFEGLSILRRAVIAFLIGLALVLFYSLCQYIDKIWFF